MYVAYPRFNGTATDLIIDWSDSFTLNGRLQEYILVGDSREMFRGIITSYRLKDLPLDRSMYLYLYVDNRKSLKIPKR